MIFAAMRPVDEMTAPKTARPKQVFEKGGAEEFYQSTLAGLLNQGVLDRDTKILAVCAAGLDRDILSGLGFRNVTISNLDRSMKGDDFAPFAGSVQDVEALSFPDGEFDFCIAHNGLHHCLSPHRALLEMYRVARRGILVFDPRDSFLTRLGVRLNFGQEYETAAVAANGCVAGGVRDTAVPNYVYRWTEREFEKTIRTVSPWGNPRFIYRYGLRVPWSRLEGMNRRIFYHLVRVLLPLLRGLFLCVPGQANGFAFAALKPKIPQDLHPWLESKDGQPVPNREWMRQRYHFK
jgi:SAM-dependent methyltransferase